jgi:DNA mismatch endonuclease, patch repair protein
MSRVRSKNTTPEIAVRKAAYACGLRFRLHRADLPGKPDLVFPRWRVALFVNGCFWHSHRNCPRARIPKSNSNYWSSKLSRNEERDVRSMKELKRLGWRSVVIWECEAKDRFALETIVRRRVIGG